MTCQSHASATIHKYDCALINIVRRYDWKLIFLVRLNPLIPFGLQNYLFGLTGIPLARFTVFSLFSCAIPAFLYANLGASINTLELTGEMRNLLTIAGLVLLLITVGYFANLYLRKSGASDKSSSPISGIFHPS